MIQAVIFDVDGTLVDSVDLHAKAWQEAFRRFGKEIPFEAIRSQIGKGGDQLKPVFLSPREIDEFGKALDDFRGDLFQREYLPRVRPFPKVRELFERIKHDGKQIALASLAKKDELSALKKIANIADLVGAERSSDDIEKSKPHPDVYESALAKLSDVRPEVVVTVGDSPYDAEAAAKAKIRTVGVLCGGFPESELRAAGCIMIYRDPADLLTHYDESSLAQ